MQGSIFILTKYRTLVKIWPGLKEFGPFMWQAEALAELAPCQLRLPQ